jgi:hypothetical protein
MNAFETAYTAATAKVDAGIIHWGTLASLLRNRIMRLDEMIRPLAGYAPVCCHAECVAERAALIERLIALRTERMA